jgi:hypothetical protein
MFKHWWSKNWNTLPEHLCLSTVFVGLVLLNLSGFFLFCFVLFFVFVEGYNDRCLSFCSFYFGHCDCCLSFFELRIVIVVCPSSSYGLWLLSVLLRVTDCDCCLSFELRIVITFWYLQDFLLIYTEEQRNSFPKSTKFWTGTKLGLFISSLGWPQPILTILCMPFGLLTLNDC